MHLSIYKLHIHQTIPYIFSAGDRYDNMIIIIIINPIDDDEDMFDKSAVYKRHMKRTKRQFVT